MKVKRKDQNIALDAETPQDIFTAAFSKLSSDEQYHYTKQRASFQDATNAFIEDQKGSLIVLDKDFRRNLQRYSRELDMSVGQENRFKAENKVKLVNGISSVSQ